jgi:hypothetical protein
MDVNWPLSIRVENISRSMEGQQGTVVEVIHPVGNHMRVVNGELTIRTENLEPIIVVSWDGDGVDETQDLTLAEFSRWCREL